MPIEIVVNLRSAILVLRLQGFRRHTCRKGGEAIPDGLVGGVGGQGTKVLLRDGL